MFKFDVSKLKKIASDANTTTMQHDDGHTIRIAHGKLSPKVREQLKAIPMFDEGGTIQANKPKDDVPEPNQDKAKKNSADSQKSGYDPSGWAKNIKEGLGFAQGGGVDLDDSEGAPKKSTEDQQDAFVKKQAADIANPELLNAVASAGMTTPVRGTGNALPFHMQAAENKAAQQVAGAMPKTAAQANNIGAGVQNAQQYQQRMLELSKQPKGASVTGFAKGGQVNPKLDESKKSPNDPKMPHYADGTPPGGAVAFDDPTNASTIPASKPYNLSDIPQMTPGEQLVQDKMDYLKTQSAGYDPESPGFNLQLSPEQLKVAAQNDVLKDQQVAKMGRDAQALKDDQQAQDTAQQDATYNAGAAQFGLPQREIPQVQQAGEASTAAMSQQPKFTANTGAQRAPASDDQSAKQPTGDNAMPSVLGGYNQQVQGANAQAKAEGDLGKAKEAIYHAQVQKAQAQQDLYKDRYDALNQERVNHIEDVRNNRIDPDKYWENHSKLAAGLGIILAGFNPKGGPNAAMDFLNHNIDRSIHAQAKNLDSAHNLLAANLHQFGNLRDATAMTRVMMNDVVANQLDEQIAKATDPMAKARAMQIKGQLQMQAAPMIQQLAMNRAIIAAETQNQQGGGQGGGSPTAREEALLPYLRRMAPAVAKEWEERIVPGIGKGTVPVPQDVRAQMIAKNTLDERAKDLYDWASKHSGVLPGTADYNTGLTKSAALQQMYRASINGGVFKKGEQEFIDGIVKSDPGVFFNKIRVLPALKEVIDSNQAQFNTLKQGYGMPIASPTSQFTPRQTADYHAAVKRLQANPNDEFANHVLRQLKISR